ncbi:MAG: translation initiation factor IF-2 [Chlamydiae bacterium]|nr:translation initiation factor IF-2 [Chlamydiota bacterium]MBI3265765.1 translation initiation factor IF-2 [Chlamydiota bacterium]
MRVHELAKELGVSSKDLIAKLKELGIEAKNHMSALETEAISKVRQAMQPSTQKVEGPQKMQSKPVSQEIPREEEPPKKEEVVSPTQEEKVEVPLATQLQQEKKILELSLPILVKDAALEFGVGVNLLIAKLIDLGERVTLNDFLRDEDIVSLLGSELGFEIQYVQKKEDALEKISEPEEEKPKNLVPRPPVVTFMGHVDHGKTSLLDQIRKTKVVDQESGGITQHIGAYQVSLKGGKITFLDTPGHEAFTLMRARGAQATDVVVLVIAADDGIMPQTEEALDHCRAANVPIMVAANKMDKPGVNSEKVKRQLSEKGLLAEDWGGQTIVCEVSAKTAQGIDHLLEMILLQAEIMELKADPDLSGRGIVIESKLTTGRGVTVTILVRQGTFRVGDALVCGTTFGRIKALFDDQGKMLREAGPSTPVEVLGLSEVPEVGIQVKVVKSEKLAREIAEKKKQELKNLEELQPKKVTLEDIFQQISEAKLKELKLILKADVRGSLEALRSSLAGVKSEEVQLHIIHEAVGDISENDVMLASASQAVIVGFHVRLSGKVKDLAKKEGVDLRTYSIIYEIVDDIRKALEGMLEPIQKEVVLGHAIVRQVFELSKSGKVAGCGISDGKASRSAKVRVLRKGEVLCESSIQSLRRFKEEVKEVREGLECGIRVEGFSEMEEGDTLEFFEIQKTAQKLPA